MIHAMVDEDECCPAMSRAIIMCAISASGIAPPSLYAHAMRFQIMSSESLTAPFCRRALMISRYVCAILRCAKSRFLLCGSGAHGSMKLMGENPMSRS